MNKRSNLSIPSISSPQWSARTKRTVALIALVVLGVAAFQLTSILPIIAVALVLSYLLNPLTTLLDQRILRWLPGSRIWAILVTFVLLVALFVVLILVVIPALFQQFQDFASRFTSEMSTLEQDIEALLSQPIVIGGSAIIVDGQEFIPLDYILDAFSIDDLNELTQLQNFDLVAIGRSFISSLTGPAVNFVGGAFNTIINAIFLLTMMFYLLKDGARFIQSIVSITPPDYRNDVRRLFYELGQVWNAYLRGQLILSSFIGVVVWLAATLLGVPNAPILALLSFFLEFIPTLGPLLAMIPAALLAFLAPGSATIEFLRDQPLLFALVVVGVWITIQNVQAVIVTPRVMGTSLNLHPFVVIVAVIAGGSLAGALGIILAAPTLASLRLAGQYLYGKLTNQTVFPALDAPDPPERSSE
ncbi:MAG: AI-2E family transporter [Chloroflexi bacterium]|nr:AI-2E family transporter [Chloroflexota bacterium]